MEPKKHVKLYEETPLIESVPLSQIAGKKIYLKMENVHSPGSFKVRGISHLCLKAKSEGCSKLVTSSGGSAGLATSYVAKHLGLKAHIVVPRTTASEPKDHMIADGAHVEVYGDYWFEANERAIELSKQSGSYYVHPFDHPTIWEGHATMINEMFDRLSEKPSAVVTSIGGGGLACGVIQGMKEVGWGDVPIVAMETIGADCFNQSIKKAKMVVLPKITSIAVCLGSDRVCQQLWDYYEEGRFIISETVEDKDAVEACLKFADHHRVLVDPACGAALAAVYGGKLKRMISDGVISGDGSIVVIVCGGTAVSLEKLAAWKETFHL